MKKTYTKYNEGTGEILFTFSCNEKGASLNAPCVEGEYSAEEYRIENGVAVKKSDADIEAQQIKKAWVDFRIRRDGLLKDSDWTQVPDAPVDQAAWAVYRQQLRDLPSNTTDPRNPAWPSPPA